MADDLGKDIIVFERDEAIYLWWLWRVLVAHAYDNIVSTPKEYMCHMCNMGIQFHISGFWIKPVLYPVSNHRFARECIISPSWSARILAGFFCTKYHPEN